MKKFLILIFVIIILSTGCLVEPKEGTKILNSYVTTNTSFQIRVVVLDDAVNKKACFVTFETKSLSSSSWRRFPHSAYAVYYSRSNGGECGSFSYPEHIKFLNNSTAYIYWGSAYLVTLDEGGSWIDWSVYQHLPDKVYDNNNLIQSVSMASNGKGEMVLNPKSTISKATIKLATDDFGQNWKLELPITE